MLQGIVSILMLFAVEMDSGKPFDISVVVFQGASTKEVFRGKIDRAIFRKWFLEDYAVGGERMEIPPEAAVFGALVVAHDSGIFVMPLNYWKSSQQSYYACQSSEIGHRPRFAVLEESRETCLSAIVSNLKECDKQIGK